MAVIDLIRHGEPEGGRRYRGATDDPLTAAGWRQMEAAVAGLSWQRIYSSPLVRCADFARHLIFCGAGQRNLIELEYVRIGNRCTVQYAANLRVVVCRHIKGTVKKASAVCLSTVDKLQGTSTVCTFWSGAPDNKVAE